uniref:Aminotransferase-like plant mobile domain-containing protein n=1 Tax=Fagus sylvatica TaxID=28930 RepID=A0A2N9HF57_FAGSY
MRGGRVGFIENRARLAQHHHARRMTVLRELWYCHVAVLSFHASSPSNPPRFPCAYPFLSDFRGQFWRSSGTQNGSCGISSESSRRPLSNDIKFARIGVRTRELWLPEVGVSELFSCTLPMKIPVKRGMLFGEPRVPRRSRSHYLSNAPGLADQLVASRKDSAREGGSCAAYFCKVPDSRESELGLVRYGPASRVHRGVFGPFEGSFPIRIPADPDKFLAIREFHVVHGCVLFPMCPGSQINLLRVRKTLCASVATSALHRGELGFARYDLANGGRRNVPYAKGGGQFDPVFGLVNGPVKPWSNLVNLGQTWSDLVKALQTPWKCIPGLHFKGFWARRTLVGLGNSSVKPRALVGSDRLGSGCLVLRADTRENPGGLRSTISFRLYVPQVSKRRRIRGRIGLGDHPGLETKFVNSGTNRPWVTTQVSKRRRIGDESAWDLTTQVSKRRRIESGTNRPGFDHPGLETQFGFGYESAWVGPPRSRNGDQSGTNRPGFDHPGLETQICEFGYESALGDPGLETNQGTNRPGFDHPGLETETNWVIDLAWMSDRGSGSGGHRRSDRLAKGKAVAYAPESSPDTDDEYDAMEDVRTRVDASLARDLQAEFDAEAAGSAPSAARAPPRPGVVIGRSAGPSETTRPSPQPSVTTGSSDAPPAAPRRAHTRSTGILPSRLKRQRSEGIPDSAGTIPEDYVAPGFRYPPHGGIRPRYPVAVEISGYAPSDEPPCSSVFSGPSLVRSLPIALAEVGGLSLADFWRFPVRNSSIHTGTFHLSTCEMAVLPVDWSAILGIRFGGRAPPSEPIDGFEAREILGLADHDATEGTRRPSVRIRYLADVLRRDREEPPTELRYRQWAAYFIFSCFLGNDRSIVPTPIVGMFRDIDTLREYDWGALTYGFYIRGLRRYSRRESISFLGFWQFTVFWAFEHFPTFAPSRLPLASDPDFPLARRWDTSRIERMTTCTLLELRMTVDCLRDADIIFQPYSAALSQRPEVFRAVALSRLRLWIRTTRSWELLLGERTVRQLGDEAVVPVDPSPLMTIEDYIPRAPSDPYIAGVSAYPSLVREGVPYQEWFEQVSLGSLMSLHEVEGGRVMGGVAMDSHHIRSSGQIERLERLEEQLQGMGITPVTGADLSGPGQPSSSPPRDPVSRDWFFDDPSPP